MTYFKQLAFGLSIVLGLVTLVPALASAQSYGTSAVVNTSVNANAASVGANANASTSVKLTAALTKAKDRGDQEIDRRVAALNDLNTRVQAMQKVSDTFKQALSTNIQTEVSGFASLKTKIDADTDGATLKTDIQSITQSYRIFALILPQGRIAAAADRGVTIVTMMSTLGSKLQARIQAAATGNDVTALNAALTDMSTKLGDAQTQAQAAVTMSAALQPDNGDKTKMASNDAALKTARADITTTTKDLVAARKDVATIIAGLAKLHVKANASSTTQTTTP